MAESEKVNLDSVIGDSKNPLTAYYIVHPNEGARILEETIAETKKLRL